MQLASAEACDAAIRDLNGAEGREFRSSLMSFLATERGAPFRLGYKPGKSRPGTHK